MGTAGGNDGKKRMTGREAALAVAGFLLLSPLFMIGFDASRSRKAAVASAVCVSALAALFLAGGTYALGGFPRFDLFGMPAGVPQDANYDVWKGTLVWLMAFSLASHPMAGYLIGRAWRGSGKGIVSAVLGTVLWIAPLAGFMQVRSNIEAGAAYTTGALDMYARIDRVKRTLSADVGGPVDHDVYAFALSNAMSRAITEDPRLVDEPTRAGFEKWKAKRDGQSAEARAVRDAGRGEKGPSERP